MNSFQKSKFRMYHAVNSFLRDNKAVWENATGVARIIAGFTQLLSTLVTVAGERARNLSGVVTARDQQKAELAEMALIISGGLVAMAAELKDAELKKRMNFSNSKLKYASPDDLIPICDQILNEAQKNADKLKEFGITDAMIQAFTLMTNAFPQSATSPRNAISTRRSHGDTITELLAETDDVLENRLDKLMLPFKKDNKPFYKEYRYNRVIVDRGSRSTKITGTVTDKQTGLPLKNVLAIVDGMAISANTTANGTFTLKVPKTGVVSVRFELPGYVSAVVKDVDVKLGKNTTIEVELVAVQG